MDLGDRMKLYESSMTSGKLIPLLPVIARLDGRSFSSFTKGLKRPYDERLSKLMVETSKYLLSETNANCAYTQSDEITLLWYIDDIESQMIFDGKLFKVISVLSSIATGYFIKNLSTYLPEKENAIPAFDCRVFNVPTLDEAVNVFLWRERDAVKNSITMAASEFYSHQFLMNKNGSERMELLFQKGVNWNDYPSFFKRGTYIQRKRTLTKYSTEELDKLPLQHNARKNPELKIERWVISDINMPPISQVSNKVDVIVFGMDPILKSEEELQESIN